jgi:hypothetical protein
VLLAVAAQSYCRFPPEACELLRQLRGLRLRGFLKILALIRFPRK